MLTQCRLQLCQSQKPGITWQEFLLLATIWSPDDTLRQPNVTARSGPSLASTLTIFKRDVGRMFKVLVHPSMHNIIRASQIKDNRLSGLGVANYVPHLCFLPCLHPEAWNDISYALLNIARATTQRVIRNIQLGHSVMLKSYCLTGKGIIKWHKFAGTARSKLLAHHNVLVVPYVPLHSTGPHDTNAHVTSVFTCPAGHERAATTPAFDPLKPTKHTWCSTCKKYINGKMWVCACRVPWYTCPHHVSILAPMAMPNRKRKAQSIRTMTQAEASHKLAKLAPNTCSRVILSPGLAARFPHLGNASRSSNDN